MDHSRLASGNAEDNVGIPDDMRCKRSDGKQWRCNAMCMPDKTVCEKHYYQAKKRAANSALRASMKKAKRKSVAESDIYLESKNDDFDMPLINMKTADHPLPISGKKSKNKVSKNRVQHSPETTPPRSSSRNFGRSVDNSQRELTEFEENWRPYKTPTGNSSRNRSQRSYDTSPMTEYSERSTDSSEDTGGHICHHCRRNSRDKVIWCLKCDRRGYCDSCISQWYSDISLEDLQKACPACRGACSCKVCLRGEHLIKMRIREIPVLDKLQYLYCLLSAVLPVIRQIHYEQCSEFELEKRLRGPDTDPPRVKLSADEQMCCNICRIPIVDYHRHCTNCPFDMCLHCCQDLREASRDRVRETSADDQIGGSTQDKESVDYVKGPKVRLKFTDNFPDWRAGSDDSIPCPPKKYGGCGYPSLNLTRIFKMNWVAKLVKNVEELVSGCKVNDSANQQNDGSSQSNFGQEASIPMKEGKKGSLYCPTSHDIRAQGISEFRKHWFKGEPVLVKQVWDHSCISSWDPVLIRRGIQDMADEKMKYENKKVRAVDCLKSSEIDIDLDQFIKGYSEGHIHENGLPKMLKLKDWPSPGASEEFLLYQRTEFISKLPLLEYIHSKWGILNLAAKVPHYSLQNDVGPKIYISYGTKEELGKGDSVTNLHFNMRDLVYLLAHTCEMKCKSWDKTKLGKNRRSTGQSILKQMHGNLDSGGDGRHLPDQHAGRYNILEDHGAHLVTNADERIEDQKMGMPSLVEEKNANLELLNRDDEGGCGDNTSGVHWDIFQRQDVPKLINYMQKHWKELGMPGSLDDIATYPLFDDVIFLDTQHMRKLREEFGVEPWSFVQHLGQAVFVPAGCPFQLRNLQSNVQLGLDFVSPESLGEAVRLAEEIRCLPNDHESKLQILEVGKISLYAASSAIKEVQKLVLDPKFGAELGFEDPNLTSEVSVNLEKITKRKQVACS
ncbi:hypothetical protein ACJRO7_011138 [Eucalyptus globulus]|uniref:Lysine-specific demethylase JMJ25 n=1 Tax=Eucalyptus globulus TaxID=34317 RepID=A0ABD3LE73_EUCGL